MKTNATVLTLWRLLFQLPSGRATFAAGERIKAGRSASAQEQAFNWADPDEPDEE